MFRSLVSTARLSFNNLVGFCRYFFYLFWIQLILHVFHFIYFVFVSNVRIMFNCLEISHFIHILENDCKALNYRCQIVSHARILFCFVSAETSTSGDAETFRFIFVAIKGLLLSLGHFDPYCYASEKHFQNVASRHKSKIQVLTMLEDMDLQFCSCFYSCAGLNTKYPSVIPMMVPLQALYSSCSHLFHLGECSLEALEEILGETINSAKEKENKNALVLFLNNFVFNSHRCLGDIFTPFGHGPCGFSLITLVCDCLFLMVVPGAPQGPFGPPGSRELFEIVAVYRRGVPRYPLEPLGLWMFLLI